MSRGIGSQSSATRIVAAVIVFTAAFALAVPASAGAVVMADTRIAAPSTGVGGAVPSGVSSPARVQAAARLALNLTYKRRQVMPKPKPVYGPWKTALCSWYWEPQGLAGGGRLTPNAMIVAHKSLPFGTRIQFSYKGRTCIAVVKDRGPYVGGREFDLGPGTAKALGFDGVDRVSYRIVY